MSHFLQAALIDFAKLLAFLFLVGCAGCAIVLILSFYEDAKVLLGYEE